jgi:hypothetical protein
MSLGNAHGTAALGTVPVLERQKRLAEVRAEIASLAAKLHELSERAGRRDRPRRREAVR